MAFETVLNKYKGLAFTIALRIVDSREDAEEVVQDAFFKVFRFIGQYKGESKFTSWLYKIVYNTSLTKIKKKKLPTSELLPEQEDEMVALSENDALINLTSNDRDKYLREAINKLSKEDALVVTLYYLAENTIPEISEITGWQNSAIKVKLHRHPRRRQVNRQPPHPPPATLGKSPPPARPPASAGSECQPRCDRRALASVPPPPGGAPALRARKARRLTRKAGAGEERDPKARYYGSRSRRGGRRPQRTRSASWQGPIAAPHVCRPNVGSLAAARFGPG